MSQVLYCRPFGGGGLGRCVGELSEWTVTDEPVLVQSDLSITEENSQPADSTCYFLHPLKNRHQNST